MEILGVDEHVGHHSPRPGNGPKELTGMVDLTRRRAANGQVSPQTRLLDLVPGRSGKAYHDWLEGRGEDFRDGVQVATLDPFRGYANAIDDQLDDAVAVLDAIHVVRLGLKAMEQTRRRVTKWTTLATEESRLEYVRESVREVASEWLGAIPGEVFTSSWANSQLNNTTQRARLKEFFRRFDQETSFNTELFVGPKAPDSLRGTSPGAVAK